QNLSNPGADRLMFWDQSGAKTEWLTVDTNTLTISGTTLSANYGSGAAGQVAYWSGSNTLTSESGFEYDATSNILSVDGIELGVSTTSGTTRRIIPVGSEGHIDLELYPKASGDVTNRKSTRLNSSHVKISYAVFCLKKKIVLVFKIIFL